MSKLLAVAAAAGLLLSTLPAMADPGAYLQITIKVKDADRSAAAEVYKKYKQPFLDEIEGATSKTLLVRTDDVQVLHGFENIETAQAYLLTDLFKADVVGGLKPLLQDKPDIRIYEAN